MAYLECDLTLARRHVGEAAQRIARQREIIEELRQAGHASSLAEDLLRALETTAGNMREHLRLIEADLAGGP